MTIYLLWILRNVFCIVMQIFLHEIPILNFTTFFHMTCQYIFCVAEFYLIYLSSRAYFFENIHFVICIINSIYPFIKEKKSISNILLYKYIYELGNFIMKEHFDLTVI